MTKSISSAWVVKYQPNKLEDMILPTFVYEYFKDKRDKGDMDKNILLSGRAGIGKSTLAQLIVKDVLGCQHLYINASDESGIDTIRTKVKRFVQTMSIDGKKKVVILDEADGLSKSSQEALRNMMEANLDNSIFILTANYSNKVIEPLQSRCDIFSLHYSVKEYVKHIATIIKKEECKVKGDLLKHIKSYYPDFRKCLNNISKFNINGVIDITEAQRDISEFIDKVFSSLLDNPINVTRELIIKNEDKFYNDYHELGVRMFNYVCDSDKYSDSVKSVVVQKIGEALRSHPHIVDAEINLFSKLIEIRSAIN